MCLSYRKGLALLLLVLLLPALPACAADRPDGEPNTIREEALLAADSYRDLRPGEGVCSQEEILLRLGEQGFPAVDVGNQCAFAHADQIEAFFATQATGKAASTRFLRVCPDGGLLDTRLYADGNQKQSVITRVAWEKARAVVTYVQEYPLTELKLTEKGNLIFTCDIPGNTAESDHDGYIEPTTMIRLTPADPVCRAWNERLIARIGYRNHTLFTADWSLEDLSRVCLNDLFPSLYRAETGKLLSYYENPYPMEENLDITLVPPAAFEAVMQLYFDLSAETIRQHAEYDRERDAYPVSIQGLHGPAVCPIPEVVTVEENPDGTICLTVDALFVEYATDRAFSHRVTVLPCADGRVRLLANEVLPGENGLLPVDYGLLPAGEERE